VECFAETVDIRLRAAVVRHERNANFRAHRANEDEAAPTPLGEFLAEMVSDVQVCHRVEPQSRLKQLPIQFQELARIFCARVGNDKADIQIVRSFGKPREEALPARGPLQGRGNRP
jgi:hypothetical protein